MIRSIICIIMCMTMLVTLSACTQKPEPEPAVEVTEAEKEELRELAEVFLTHLINEENDAAIGMCDATVSKSINAEQLQGAWQSNIIIKLGEYEKFIDCKYMSADGYNICLVYTSHGGDTENAGVSRVVFDSERKIAGIFFYTEAVPAENGVSSSADGKVSLLPENVIEQSVVIGDGGDYPLDGKLTLPKDSTGPLTAVVLLSGSGPNDKDETIYGNKPLRDIAYGLSARGIAVLRFDKRTYTHGERVVADFGADMTVKEEYIEDAILAKQLLENDSRIDKEKIFILGHSEGGMLAPRIAEEGDFCGMVIMAGTLRSMPELIPEQYEYLCAIAGLTEEQTRKELELVYRDYEVYKSLDSLSDEEVKELTIFGCGAYYFREMDEHPSRSYLEATQKPVLVLQGKADYQVLWDVDFAEYKALSEKKDNIKCILYDNLNHLFMVSPGEKSVPNEYQEKGAVDLKPIEDIAQFLSGVLENN